MGHFENDLSKGNVVRQLILFAFPFLVSSIIQSLYNVADMLIVGNFSGTASMSGVNIGGPGNLYSDQCCSWTLFRRHRFGRPVSWSQKAKRYGGYHRDSYEHSAGCGVIITIVMLVLKNQVLILIKTPAGIL